MKKTHIYLLLGLFLLVITSSRMLWMDTFQKQKQVSVQSGELDLRNWDAEEGDIILLDGEWEFYPSQLIMDHSMQLALEESEVKRIDVPGKWSHALYDEKSEPYGYASYRLRLYVNPEKDLNYSIRVPSVRTASELYVNGRLIGKSGQVAKTEEAYTAKNLPYSAAFTADENGVIDLVIQAANYVDSRGGGIARSLKFGSEAAILKEMKISTSMQLLATIIFLLHCIYALILYLLGNRDKKLLYFSVLSLCVTLTSTLSNDEKLFHQLFYIGNEWDFRLTNFSLIISLYALLNCTDHRELPYWKKVYPYYAGINLGTGGMLLFLDPHQIIFLFPVFYLLGSIACAITVTAIFRKVTKDVKSNLLILCSIIALIHHFAWSIIWREGGLSVVHYPFDLIIAMGCYATVWFKEYFKTHAKTIELAATLQRMNSHKDQFLANTSHEFKNPLHGILNLSQSVLRRERHLLQERSIKELETVLSVGHRMTFILNDLIDVMSLQEGNPRLHKKAVSVRPIVTGVADMLQYNAEMKSIRIVNHIPEDFPPVFADENRLIQVVFNLVHNAVKYTNKGTVAIRAFTKDEMAFIVISDTGIGIDESMLKRLFQPYEQASASEIMIEGGFGLGLSISKQLVELHGGTLDVSSVVGQGSEFMFSLKLADVKEKDGEEDFSPFEPFGIQSMPVLAMEEIASDFHEVEIPSMTDQAAFTEMNRNRPHVLIVDDDPVNLQVIDAILPPDEYVVTTVTSGKKALALLDTKDWDLVVSDIMMPQMSGYELTRTIRQRFTMTELPVLLLTARSQPKDIQSGFLAGANDYVTKPVEAIEIRSRIEALISIKQMVQKQLNLEAAWLQAQIQPHFLFNTLNAVMALSEMNLEQMRNLLDEFSNFLRYKFQFHNMDELIPIEDELSLVRSYLYIEKVRFEERLHVVWDTDECGELSIPFLSIQPLVENAIKHGIMKRAHGGTIHIQISNDVTHAEICVKDDGVGMDEDQLQRILERKADRSTGIGLINTDQRLKRHFGAGLHITSTPGIGTTVTFRVNKR